jgi:flagellar protein FlaG
MSIEQIGSTVSPPILPAATVVTKTVAPESQAVLLNGSAAVQGAQASQTSAAVKQPSKGDVQEAVKKIEQVLSPAAQGLRFSIDSDTGINVVKLIDSQTQEVLRQIPSQEVIDISKALDKLQGLLVKARA